MIVPSLACPAQCSYCFGPRKGPVVSSRKMDETLEFIQRIAHETGQARIEVTYHGGEPLAAGHPVLGQALEGLALRFGEGNVRTIVQSNLWLLDDNLCRMFVDHRVAIGTSLDGPEEITDNQRGKGYFSRTMAGVSRARSHGLNVSCIATFTTDSWHRWKEVFDFFLEEGIGLSFHAAVPSIGSHFSPQTLSPNQYGKLLLELLNYYVEHRRETTVSSLDHMCKGVFRGEGQVCTFRDCLGEFLVIDPLGDIYACQRMAGIKAYCLGNVSDRPTLKALLESPTARNMRAREREVEQTCGGCRHYLYCRGGCAYNAWARGRSNDVRDLYCTAYRALFDGVKQRLDQEMASRENIETIVSRPVSAQGDILFRKGPLIELVRDGPHPSMAVRSARRIVAAVTLARESDLGKAAARLVQMDVARNQQSGEASLLNLRRRLQPGALTTNNLYVHVTSRCQLACTHCYACADAAGMLQRDMPVNAIIELIRQAKALGFRQVIITGGEPLMHGQREALFTRLAEARQWSSPLSIVLRSNLAMSLNPEEISRIAVSADQVIVSLDGDEASHDARRGLGAYVSVVRNLDMYAGVAAASESSGELSLAAVMTRSDAQGVPGESVRRLARDLGIGRIRFKPLLPIGRAAEWGHSLTPEAPGAYEEPAERIEGGFQPMNTCGFGQNLYVESSGQSFPCYAYRRPHACLGNVIEEGLESVLSGDFLRSLGEHTVDSNPKCRQCDVRYLCGGACRAWGGESAQYNLDAPPTDCGPLREQAEALLTAAHEFLGVKLGKEVEESCSGK
jgi:uncharacterized protein